tara:strand:+ start:64 stop:492 length:429 start_codon:yes stop_codon:yes gene_type:complete
MDTKELSKEQCITLVNRYALEIAKANFEIRARQKEFADEDFLCIDHDSDEWKKAHPQGFMTGFKEEKVEMKKFEKSTLANMINTLTQRRKRKAKLELVLYKVRVVGEFLWNEEHSVVNAIYDCKTKEEINELINLVHYGNCW